MNKTIDRSPTLEDFCDAANDLYAAPTEERFLAVGRVDQYRAVVDGVAWKRRIGWSGVLAGLRKALPRVMSPRRVA